SPPMSLQSIDNVHGDHHLPPLKLGIGHSAANDVLNEDAAMLHVDEATGPWQSLSFSTIEEEQQRLTMARVR
ncbi:hypothetical protein U1Q18_015255, partial [Sarracenia purpurea var. burkii]